MKLVEVTKGLGTSEETFEKVYELAKALEKNPVKVNDAPGFVGNRIMIPMINEAIFTLSGSTAIDKHILILNLADGGCLKEAEYTFLPIA